MIGSVPGLKLRAATFGGFLTSERVNICMKPSLFNDESLDSRCAAAHAPRLLRHCWLNVSGLRIHLITAGNQGRPVLVLHGGGLDAAGLSFGRTIPVLAEQYRVFAPDWPGFGESDAMPITWRVEECVKFLADLLDALGLKRANLIGVSMGGGFALGFALEAPQKVERLVLVNSGGLGREIPGGFLSYFAMRLPFMDELRWALLIRSRTIARRILCAALVNRKEALSEEVLEEIIRLARRPGAGAAFRQLQRSEYQWMGLRTNYAHRLSEVKVPTLIVHGAQDRIVPVSWAQRAHNLIKNSRLEIIRRCGHMPPIEQPEVFNEIVRCFLLGRCESRFTELFRACRSLAHHGFQIGCNTGMRASSPQKSRAGKSGAHIAG
jgi:pimeloyl-ACP methyl ester carboxylesterase